MYVMLSLTEDDDDPSFHRSVMMEAFLMVRNEVCRLLDAMKNSSMLTEARWKQLRGYDDTHLFEEFALEIPLLGLDRPSWEYHDFCKLMVTGSDHLPSLRFRVCHNCLCVPGAYGPTRCASDFELLYKLLMYLELPKSAGYLAALAQASLE